MITNLWATAPLIAVLTLASCSGPVTTTASSKSEPEKTEAPPAAVSALTAFWEMYKPAHAWAADILPLTMAARTVKGIKNEDGKAGIWEATFGSPSLKQYSKFTYSVIAQPPDIRKGVTASGSVPWAGQTKEAMAFTTGEFTIDSDAAYKTAFEKAGPWLKAHPGIELTEISLGAASRFPGPVWYFLWGDKKLGFFQLVSASTGKALK